MKLHLIKHYEPNRDKADKHILLISEKLNKQRLPYSSLLEEFDIFEAAKNGFHIVSVAFIGLTNFSSVCQYGFGINQQEQDKFITPINTKKETGTLFPKYNLTILPYRYRTTPIMTIGEYDYTNGNGFTIEEVETHIKDAFKSLTDYIKSNKIILDFRDLGEDMLRYRNFAHSYLSDFKDFEWDCYMYSFDNSEFV